LPKVGAALVTLTVEESVRLGMTGGSFFAAKLCLSLTLQHQDIYFSPRTVCITSSTVAAVFPATTVAPDNQLQKV
jgi:hypothetical protein